MPYYCTVPRCTSMAGKAKNVSFHQFPKDEELAELWNTILKRGKPYTKYSKVCSLHFTPEDYTINSVGNKKGQWRSLRKDAVPSRNLPSESPAPYQRHSSTQPATPPSLSPSMMDPQLQQQFAQAIYVQTMLALQAASYRDTADVPQGNSDSPTSSADNTLDASNPLSLSQIQQMHEFIQKYHSARLPINHMQNDLQFNQSGSHQSQPTEPFKCTECARWFKDPDVFILHQRTHKNRDCQPFNQTDSASENHTDSATDNHNDEEESSPDENCDPDNFRNIKTDANIDSDVDFLGSSNRTHQEALTLNGKETDSNDSRTDDTIHSPTAGVAECNPTDAETDADVSRTQETCSFNRNVASNPILTNLLNQKVPDNCLTNENVMTAMALSMEAYVRSINGMEGSRNTFQNGGKPNGRDDELNESTESNRLVIDETA